MFREQIGATMDTTGRLNQFAFAVPGKVVRPRVAISVPVVPLPLGDTCSLPAEVGGTLDNPRVRPVKAIEHPVEIRPTSFVRFAAMEPVADPTR